MTVGSDQSVWSAVVRWIATTTGAKAIKANEGGKRPALPYVMVNLTGTAEVREHPANIEYAPDRDEEETTGAVTAYPVIEVEWRFSVHAFGNEPTGILRPIRSAYQLAQVQEPLLPGLVISEVSQIRNIPEWVNNAWEPRAQVDVIVRGFTRDGFVIDVIDEASVDIDRL